MQKTPWHIWVVGVLALAWAGIGAIDYVMTQTRNPGYMAQFTQDQGIGGRCHGDLAWLFGYGHQITMCTRPDAIRSVCSALSWSTPVAVMVKRTDW